MVPAGGGPSISSPFSLDGKSSKVCSICGETLDSAEGEGAEGGSGQEQGRALQAHISLLRPVECTRQLRHCPQCHRSFHNERALGQHLTSVKAKGEAYHKAHHRCRCRCPPNSRISEAAAAEGIKCLQCTGCFFCAKDCARAGLTPRSSSGHQGPLKSVKGLRPQSINKWAAGR